MRAKRVRRKRGVSKYKLVLNELATSLEKAPVIVQSCASSLKGGEEFICQFFIILCLSAVKLLTVERHPYTFRLHLLAPLKGQSQEKQGSMPCGLVLHSSPEIVEKTNTFVIQVKS